MPGRRLRRAATAAARRRCAAGDAGLARLLAPPAFGFRSRQHRRRAPAGTCTSPGCSDTRSCGRFGPGEARLDRREIELDRLGVDRVGRVGACGTAPAPSRTPRPAARAPRRGRSAAGSRASSRRSGRSRSSRRTPGDMLPSVARSAIVRYSRPGPEELDELADDAVLAQALGDRQHEVGRGRAFGQSCRSAGSRRTSRNQHRDRLAEHRRLGLDAADAPADHAEPVDHRRVRVGADQRVGIRERCAVRRAR